MSQAPAHISWWAAWIFSLFLVFPHIWLAVNLREIKKKKKDNVSVQPRLKVRRGMLAATSALRYSSKMGHLHCPREKAKKKPNPQLTTFFSLNHPLNSPCLLLVSGNLMKFPQTTAFQGRMPARGVRGPPSPRPAAGKERPRSGPGCFVPLDGDVTKGMLQYLLQVRR